MKTLHRTEAKGRPQGSDAHYSRAITLVEERVVIFKALSFQEAIHRAEVEARRYARQCRHRSPYGQSVRSRYLGYCEAYLLFGRPGHGDEVFSVTEVVSRRLSDRAVTRRAFGRRESPRTERLRRNILNIAFNAPAPGVTRTRAERAVVGRRRVARGGSGER